MGTIPTQLPDGTPVLLRHVEPGDGETILRVFNGLSTQSRLFRFLRVIDRLEPRELDMFAHADHTQHEAITAIVGRPGEEEPAAVGHFFRATGAPDRAEMSLAVVDAWQRRGLGALILGRLLRRARDVGITRFDAMVHNRNMGMSGILKGLGATSFMEGTTLIYELPVHGDPARYPATHAGDAVRRSWALGPPALAA